MKANEAPEKLYLDATSKCDDTVFTIRNNDTDVEYTRTDAFIEKAAEYLMDYEFNDSPTITDRRKRVEDFKKYMND